MPMKQQFPVLVIYKCMWNIFNTKGFLQQINLFILFMKETVKFRTWHNTKWCYLVFWYFKTTWHILLHEKEICNLTFKENKSVAG